MSEASPANPRPVLDSEVQQWQSCIGRQRQQTAMADAEVLRRFALAAGLNPDVESGVPLLAHWALFADAVDDSRIGEDGHPLRGDFLPAIHLPRRMFAAATLSFHRPLMVGTATQCRSTITGVEHKRGRSGDLVFVTVRREIFQHEALCTTEEQSLVYRGAGAAVAPIENSAEPPSREATPAMEVWQPGPVQLFRFSAVTYNAHRIHYDLPYARQQEGYPDLVVHGPFTAVKLLDYACRLNQRPPQHFSFRGVAPIFVSQPIYLSRAEAADSFIATRCDGTAGMTATVEFK